MRVSVSGVFAALMPAALSCPLARWLRTAQLQASTTHSAPRFAATACDTLHFQPGSSYRESPFVCGHQVIYCATKALLSFSFSWVFSGTGFCIHSTTMTPSLESVCTERSGQLEAPMCDSSQGMVAPTERHPCSRAVGRRAGRAAAQGKDAVPDSVDHVLVHVDPRADRSWLQSSPPVTTDGCHTFDASGAPPERGVITPLISGHITEVM